MGVTYDVIKKANEEIKPIKIERYDKKQGKMVVKEYAEVHERVKAFRMVYPNGFIITECLSDEEGRCVFKASVGFYDDDGEPKTIGTGMAYEMEKASKINSTSYIENCETSAVGRALGFCGFGIDSSIASAEETNHAIDQQESFSLHSLDNLSSEPSSITSLQISIVNSWSDERRDWFMRSARSDMEGLDVQEVKDVSELTAQILINKVKRQEGRGRR